MRDSEIDTQPGMSKNKAIPSAENICDLKDILYIPTLITVIEQELLRKLFYCYVDNL